MSFRLGDVVLCCCQTLIPLTRRTRLLRPLLLLRFDCCVAQEVQWPRELYLKILSCKGLAAAATPDKYSPADGSTTTTTSTTTTMSNCASACAFSSSNSTGAISSNAAQVHADTIVSLDSSSTDAETVGIVNGDGSGGDGAAEVEPQENSEPTQGNSGSVSLTHGLGDDEIVDGGAGDTEAPATKAGDGIAADGNVELTDEAVGEGRLEEEMEWFVRITNTTTGNDLQVGTWEDLTVVRRDRR